MKKTGWLLIVFLLGINSSAKAQQPWQESIDSFITAPSSTPFNGIIHITRRGTTLYSKLQGWSNMEAHKKLKKSNQFIIGSISKQITAVLVLREYDLGHLQLNDPIGKYLPHITQPWAGEVTIHHLLCHMHGIEDINRPLMFQPGAEFNYGQANLGYLLLSKIIEKTAGKSFAEVCADLFKKCGMNHTFHPDIKKYKQLVNGYTEQENNSLAFEPNSFQNAPGAGGFISTADDLVKWNQQLHGGKLLQPDTYRLMTTRQPGAVRNHPLFGTTYYGYGITTSSINGLLQLGQTGFAPGFVSLNFYFPASQTSLILLENIAYQTQDLTKTFYYHLQVFQIVKTQLLLQEK